MLRLLGINCYSLAHCLIVITAIVKVIKVTITIREVGVAKLECDFGPY